MHEKEKEQIRKATLREVEERIRKMVTEEKWEEDTEEKWIDNKVWASYAIRQLINRMIHEKK